jgi:hypothetical protein
MDNARVSTREQDLTGQVAELRAAGCTKIYSEKASGARGDCARPISRRPSGRAWAILRSTRQPPRFGVMTDP